MEKFDEHIFQSGLVQPPTRVYLLTKKCHCCKVSGDLLYHCSHFGKKRIPWLLARFFG